MERTVKEPMLYKVSRAKLEDEVQLSNGSKKANVIVVLLQDTNGNKQRIFVTEEHEKARKKGRDIPDFLANIGKIVSLETEHQIAGRTGYETKDEKGKVVEVLHTEDKLQPTPFGYVGTEEDAEEYQSDLRANKAENRRISNIKSEMKATNEALMDMDSKSIEFYKNNPHLASVLQRR